MITIGTVHDIDLDIVKQAIKDRTENIEWYNLHSKFSSNEDAKIVHGLKDLWDKSWSQHYFPGFERAVQYSKLYEQNMDLCYIDDQYAIVRLPDGKRYELVPVSAIQFELFKDYSNTPISALRLSGSGLDITNSLILREEETLNTKQDAIKNKKAEIEAAKENIRKMEEEKKAELEKLRQELEAKYADKMLALQQKKNELYEMQQKLEGELFILDTEIYGIRCFFGETVKFSKITSGNNEPDTEPIVLYQKVRFLDEELGKAVAMYDFDGSDCKMFEELVKAREDVRNLFFPEGKSISLVRISADGKVYGSTQTSNTVNKTTYVSNIMREYEVYHGTKIAILVRNGDNCYIGWTDIDKINIADGNAFYSPKTEITEANDSNSDTSSTKDDIASRYFIFSILQGLVLNSKILTLPEGEDIMKSNPKYVVYSLADNWITDTRFGDFNAVLERTKGSIKKGDIILTMQSLSAEGDKYRSFNNDRGRGYMNRTHDVYARDCTLYTINLVESEEHNIVRYSKYDNFKEVWVEDYKHGKLETLKFNSDYKDIRSDKLTTYKYFISLKKEDSNARANFEVYPDEFLNMTFMNSVFIKYIILNKKIDKWRVHGRQVNFSYLLPYLNTALQFLDKREEEEYELISKYIKVDKNSEWQVILSDWKVVNDVHDINEKQAKKFVDYILVEMAKAKMKR